MRIESLPQGCTADAVLAVLERDGVAVLRARNAPAVAATVAETAPWLDRARPGTDEFRGHHTRRAGALIARSPSYCTLVLDPVVLAAAEGVLAARCARIQMTYTQAIRLGPGETAQPLHRDDEVYPLPPPAGGEWAFICMWAGTDFTAENGATLVVPGSHRWDRRRVAEKHEVVAAEMPAGSVLVHLGSVLHAGGANSTNAARIGFSVNYALGWLRQIENQALAVPPNIARTLDPRLQDLLGYSVHGRILGECALEDPRIAVLGQGREAVDAYERERGHAADPTTLSGYGRGVARAGVRT